MEAEKRALRDITNAHTEQRQTADELDALRSQFKAYQKVKTREVQGLTTRLKVLLQQQAVAGGVIGTDRHSSSPGVTKATARCVYECVECC